MSAFDDEFGLFDDEVQLAEDDERRSTLGARTVSSGETIIDEIEMDDDERPRGRRRPEAPAGSGYPSGHRRHRTEERRPSAEPSVLRDRAVELLSFLAKGLVSKPEFIKVAAHDEARQGMVLELEVAADDLGKVIGRGGRVAQALRTVVRAGAEGRVAIEIIDVDDGSEKVAMTVVEGEAESVEPAEGEESTGELAAKKKPRAPRPRRPRAKKDADAVDAATTEPDQV